MLGFVSVSVALWQRFTLTAAASSQCETGALTGILGIYRAHLRQS